MDKRILPADRLSKISEYYFSRKLKEVARLNAEGYDIISLGIGGPDLMPPYDAVEAAAGCLHRSDSHSYQMTTGLPALRHAYADWYARWYGVRGLDEDRQILPLIGSKEGVLQISLAFLNPGDGVLVPNPGYPTYSSASNIALAEIFTYDLSEENGWMPDFEEIEKLPLERIKLMWVNYPHMPTGTPASLELFQRLVDFGRRHGILIVNDNPYSFILNDKPLSILNIEGAEDVALEMNSLSKCMNMAGWRLGMLVGNPEYISWVLKVKSNMDSGQPRAMMEGAVAALDAGREWYEGLNAVYGRRKEIGLKIMEALGCTCRLPQQGLFLWGRIPDKYSNVEELTEILLHQARVFVTPGFIFGSAGDRYIRISLCAPEPQLAAALDRIRHLPPPILSDQA